MVRDGKRDKVMKLDEFTAAIETAKTLAETKPFQTETRRQENHRASKAAVKGAVRNRGCAQQASRFASRMLWGVDRPSHLAASLGTFQVSATLFTERTQIPRRLIPT